jgi:divalent metal cation (Fe/Co/Zn/Cd) transporter
MNKHLKSVNSLIVITLAGNFLSALLKLLMVILSGSIIFTAEFIRSFVTSLNQCLLLIGMRGGRKNQDSLHPFGFSSELYIWSYIISIIMFGCSAFYAIFRGIHYLKFPVLTKAVPHPALIVLFLLLVEGIILFRNYRHIRYENPESKLLNYLRSTKKTELSVLFIESSLGFVSLTMAILSLTLSSLLSWPKSDGIFTMIIGICMACQTLLIGNELKLLLAGDNADPEIIKQIFKIFQTEESINRLIYLKSTQLEANDIVIAVKAEFNERLNASEVQNLIAGIELEIKQKFANIRKIFIEAVISHNSF